MYPEFIAIYVGMIIIIAMLAAIIVLILSSSKQPNSKINISKKNIVGSLPNKEGEARGGIVFCKNCSTQFSSNTNICPHCGTPR